MHLKEMKKKFKGPNGEIRNASAQAALLDIEIPARAECLVQARQAVAQVAERLHLTNEATDDVLMAVGEACNNAVLYGSMSAASPVRVQCRLDKSKSMANCQVLQIDIANAGNGFLPGRDDKIFSMPDPDDLVAHGRGMPLMRMLMDDVQILHQGGGTLCRLTKRIS